MGIFTAIYQKVLAWSEHRFAPYYLAGVSFAESSMFPVPPDVMLISMALAKPHRSWRFAFVATISSVLGGMLGYWLGYVFMSAIHPYIVSWGYGGTYEMVERWFTDWGVWVVFIAGFSPVPYKLFTLGAGAMHAAFLPFVLASIIGRGLRFYLVAAAMFWGGARIQKALDRYIEIIGWVVVAVLVLLYGIYWIHSHFPHSAT